MKSKICNTEIYRGLICPNCHFDYSLDFESYFTLSPTMPEAISVSEAKTVFLKKEEIKRQAEAAKKKAEDDRKRRQDAARKKKEAEEADRVQSDMLKKQLNEEKTKVAQLEEENRRLEAMLLHRDSKKELDDLRNENQSLMEQITSVQKKYNTLITQTSHIAKFEHFN